MTTAAGSYEVKPRSWWVYVGPQEGRGIKHMVLENEEQVVTWSDPNQFQSSGGWSWMGPLGVFLKHFKPI